MTDLSKDDPINVSLLIVKSNWALFVAGSEQDPSVWPEIKALKGN